MREENEVIEENSYTDIEQKQFVQHAGYRCMLPHLAISFAAFTARVNILVIPFMYCMPLSHNQPTAT